MKAIISIKKKIKKPSLSTSLFWVGLLLALLASFLPLVTGAQLIFFLIGVIGFVLSSWQKIAGDHDQRQQLEEERKRNETVSRNMVLNTTTLKIESNLISRAPDTMPTRESQAT